VNGDAVLVVAPNPTAALRVVTRIFDLTAQEADFPALRAGLHHGEAAARDAQFYGTAVNVAARVAAHATSGQTLGTHEVALAARSVGHAVGSLGRVSLKNIREPIELFSIAMNDERLDTIDPVCRMRIAQGSAAAHLRLGNQEYWFCSRECLQTFVAAQTPSSGA
jgi:adenylate cyclase